MFPPSGIHTFNNMRPKNKSVRWSDSDLRLVSMTCEQDKDLRRVNIFCETSDLPGQGTDTYILENGPTLRAIITLFRSVWPSQKDVCPLKPELLTDWNFCTMSDGNETYRWQRNLQMETIQTEMKNASENNIYTDGKQILGSEKEHTQAETQHRPVLRLYNYAMLLTALSYYSVFYQNKCMIANQSCTTNP